MYLSDHLSPSIALGGFDEVDEGRLLRITGRGLWTMPMLDAHFVTLAATLRAIRATRGYASVLVDLRHAPPQSATVSAQLDRWTAKLYTARDRVAIVVASSLLKAQMRRTAMVATRELFVSLNAAEVWLCAPDARDFDLPQVA